MYLVDSGERDGFRGHFMFTQKVGRRFHLSDMLQVLQVGPSLLSYFFFSLWLIICESVVFQRLLRSLIGPHHGGADGSSPFCSVVWVVWLCFCHLSRQHLTRCIQEQAKGEIPPLSWADNLGQDSFQRSLGVVTPMGQQRFPPTQAGQQKFYSKLRLLRAWKGRSWAPQLPLSSQLSTHVARGQQLPCAGRSCFVGCLPVLCPEQRGPDRIFPPGAPSPSQAVLVNYRMSGRM